MQTQVIAVNATALKDGGALSILKQFIEHIPEQGIFYIFIHPDVVLDNKAPHVHLIPIDCSSAFKRLMWDAFGFKRWLDERHLKAEVVVSLQNTSVAYDKQVKQVIYLHQGLCLHPQTWSFFKKSERRFAFYKSIYPLFIFLFAHKKTHFIVQTRWMKEALCQKFKVLSEHVHVIKPDIIRVAVDEVEKKVLSHPHVLFYPATGYAFKNHQVLIRALFELKQPSIALYLTFHAEDNPELTALIHRLGLSSQVYFLGPLSYAEVLMYYKSCTMVVFPSAIESFGLPLVESAMFGKPLVVVDAPYAHEVIGEYPKAIFAAQNNPKAWKRAVLKALALANDETAYQPKYHSDWSDVFRVICED